MEHLSLRDLRSLLEFLRQCYALQDREGFVAHLLTGTPKLVPSDITSFNEMDAASAKSENWMTPAEALTSERAKIWERFMHQQPILAHHLATGDGQASKVSDFLTKPRFHDLGLYQDLYRGMDTERVMAVFLATPQPLSVALALHRKHRDFSERDRTVLNLLCPHLLAIYRTITAMAHVTQTLALLTDGLDALAQGLIVVDTAGRILQINTSAQDLLDAYFRTTPRQSRCLPEALQRWIRHEEDSLAATDAAPQVRQQLVIERDDKRLVVRLIGPKPVGRWLLLLEHHDWTFDPTTFQVLGLTRREAEVLSWLAQGKTNGEVATILGTRPRTIAKHLEHIFPKIGVETRTAAANLAITASAGRRLQS